MVIKTAKQRQGKLLQKAISRNLNKAEFEIYREAQLESFATEFDNLLNNEPITNKSKILSLTPIFVENLIQVRGRVQKSYCTIANKLFSISLTCYQN